MGHHKLEQISERLAANRYHPAVGRSADVPMALIVACLRLLTCMRNPIRLRWKS